MVVLKAVDSRSHQAAVQALTSQQIKAVKDSKLNAVTNVKH
ncbi:Putative uncharacterized protein [Moritella viscosa]|nr:Putative uncharacterized protein [Moritella viscosa]